MKNIYVKAIFLAALAAMLPTNIYAATKWTKKTEHYVNNNKGKTLICTLGANIVDLKQGEINGVQLNQRRAIVNAANQNTNVFCNTQHAGGVAGAILKAYNPQASGFCTYGEVFQQNQNLQVGSVHITGPGALSNKYEKIIHAVGPQCATPGQATQAEINQLRTAYQQTFQVAAKNGIEAVVCPLISTGVFGFPPKEAIKIFIEQAMKTLNSNNNSIKVIHLALYDPKNPNDASLYNQFNATMVNNNYELRKISRGWSWSSIFLGTALAAGLYYGFSSYMGKKI